MERLDTEFQILSLVSGAKTLRSLAYGETFHPGIGPTQEARILHVEQQKLNQRCEEKRKFIIWDVGLGAAANAITAIDALSNSRAEIEIHSFDKSLNPLLFALKKTDALEYLEPYQNVAHALIEQRSVLVRPGLSWHLHLGDFRGEVENLTIPAPHSVFYDPYSSGTNREMWTLAHFTNLYRRLAPDCLLTNYTRSTSVRITLLLAGFFVGKGCIIGDKSETSIASNNVRLLEEPLGKKFFHRAKISPNAAVIRDLNPCKQALSEEDLATLALHPQFLGLT